MVRQRRPFNPNCLAPFAIAAIRPLMGVGAMLWRYTILVPIEEVRAGQDPASLATPEDLDNLRGILCDHFGGVTILPALLGFGLRDPRQTQSLELNKNVPFVIYASPVAASDKYFERLQQELQEALVQGVILVELQEAFVFGGLVAEVTALLPAPVQS